VRSLTGRLAAIERQLAAADKREDDPELRRVMKSLADQVREAALNPKPGMEDINRAYAAVFSPLYGQQRPNYADGWEPGERYWCEVARIVDHLKHARR
jgi:hypothetical protein